MELLLTPGALVRHPEQPDWGLGQVQSAIGHQLARRLLAGEIHDGDTVCVDLDAAGDRLTLTRG